MASEMFKGPTEKLSAWVWKIFPEQAPAALPITRKRLVLTGGSALFACLLVLLVYWPIKNLPLLTESIVEQDLATLSPWQFLFRSAYLQEGWGVYYRFGSRLVDHLLLRAGGGSLEPSSNHLFQIIMHVMCTGLLFLLIWIQSGFRLPGATAGALGFGLHPSITGAVVLVAVRWTVTSTLVLLILCLIYQLLFLWRREKPPLFVLVALAPLVLFLALIAEIGTLGMGVLGLWLFILSLRRREWLYACMLPLVPVPIIYLVIRHIAIGNISQPYAGLNPTWIELITAYARNLLYDTNLLLNPIRFSFFHVEPGHSSGVVAADLVIVAVIVLLFAFKKSRRVLLSYPLPLIGIACFVLFQLNALWRIEKTPIGTAGIDRGYVYYMPMMFVFLLAGSIVNRLFMASNSVWRLSASVALGFYLLASAGVTKASIQLWREAGGVVAGDKMIVSPFLQQLDEGTSVYMKNFPDALRKPYLPWALTYYYTHGIFFDKWAGKDLDVISDYEMTSLPEGFSGWVVTRDESGIHWYQENPGRHAQRYIEYHENQPRRMVMPLLTENTDLLLKGKRANVNILRNEEGVARVELTGRDPWILLTLGIKPEEAGILRYEIRILDSESAIPPGTQVYFSGPESSFIEENSVQKLLADTNEWQVVQFNLFASPNWMESDEIKALRFDFFNQKGTVEIRNFVLDNDISTAKQVIEQYNQAE